jgi:hypothetical protein
MQSLWRLTLTIAVAIGFAIRLAPPAAAAGSVAGGYRCSAEARQGIGWIHPGKGDSPLQAEARAMSKCRAWAWHPETCQIVESHCRPPPPGPRAPTVKPAIVACVSPPTTPSPSTDTDWRTIGHRWVDGLRQKEIPINSASLSVAALIHLLWIWHIISFKTLAKPVKAGLGLGVLIVQTIFASLLGSDGEIPLLELSVFSLPLGLGELVASLSLKRRSE